MPNIFDRLIGEAQKKKKQLETNIANAASSAVRAPVQTASRIIDQANPYDAGRTFKQRTPTVQNKSVASQYGTLARNTSLGMGLRTARSATSVAQGVSGLADLAGRQINGGSPTATSRVSKGLDRFAKNTDNKARQMGVNTTYQTSALPIEAASFALGGGLIKGTSLAVSKGVPAIGKVASGVERFVGPATKAINKKITKLEDFKTSTPIGRIQGTALKAVTRPANVTNMAVGTGLDLGTQASKGNAISRRDVAISAATNLGLGIGVPVAGRVVAEAVPAVLPGVKAVAKATTKGVKAVDNTRKDTLKAQADTKSYADRQADVDKRIKFKQGQMNALPATPSNAIKVNGYMRDLDILNTEKTSMIKPAARTLKQKIVDKVVTAQPGLTVGGPNATDYMYAKKHGRTFNGVDGKTRFEIDDSGAKLNDTDIDLENGSFAGDLLDHPELYKNYPGLKNLPIEIDRQLTGNAGLDSRRGVMKINPKLTEQVQTLQPDYSKIKRSDVEDYLISQGYTKQQLDSEVGNLSLKDLIDNTLTQDEINKIGKLEDPKFETRLKKDSKGTILHEIQHDIQDYEKFDGGGAPKSSSGKDLEDYRRFGGEAEARAVSARMNMTPSERAAKPFYDSFDIPKKDLVISNNNGVAMSIDKRAYADDLSPEQNKFIAEKISPAQLEKIRANEAQIGQPVKPANLTSEQSQQYVKSMTKAQKDAQKGGSSIAEKTGDFKEKFIDDLAPIEDRLNKAIKNGTPLDPREHITYQLDRSRRSEGIMNAYVRDNKLDKIIQNVDKADEFDQYLIARHSRELGPEIRTGRNAANDAAIVKQLDAKYGAAAKELYTYNQKLLDTSVEYGLISKATAVSLKKRYPEYVPFNRIFNEDELANLAGGNGKGNASISSQGVVKKIKGSDRAIASPLNSIIDKTRVVIEQGERNQAAQLLASYKKLPGNPFNLKEIPKNENIGGRSTISFLDNGVKRTFETDKMIADAAKNMTRQDIGLWGRIAAVPARVLRGGATTVNVGFAGANIVKDIVGAAINSKHPLRIADPEAFGKALSAALYHKGKSYQELMREGVSGTSFDMFRNPMKSNVAEIRSQKNPLTRAGYVATHPSQMYRTLENTIGRSEDFGRALQYYSNKKGFAAEGKTPDVSKLLAAAQARNNSTNFYRHGSVGKGVNLAIPYWNAGVQGARIGVNRIKERPAQTLGKIGLAIAAPSAMIAVNNYSDETKRQVMEDIPDYEKQGNVIIVGPNPRFNEETNKWEGVFKFPVPPQYIGIHKTIQDAVRSTITGENFDIVDNLGRITEDYTTINPTDGKALASRYIPQALKLVAEPLTNTNFYTGNKIVPDSQKNLPAKDQYNDYSSGTAKTIGKLGNLSPRQIDNTIRTGLGGAGQNLVNATDNLLAKTGVIGKEEIKGKNLTDSIKGRFYGPNAISPGDKADKQFAKLKKEVTTSNEYKNASQYDKGRMLNRLESDLNAVAYSKDGKGDDKLTKKQKSLDSSGFNKDTYTNLDSKGSSIADLPKGMNGHDIGTLKRFDGLNEDEKTAIYQKENNAEYKLKVAQFERDKKLGKLSRTQLIETEDKVRKAKVGSSFTKDTRDLYGLSKQNLWDFVSSDNNGQKYLDDVIAYGDALLNAGVIEKNTFRDSKGNLSVQPREKGSGGSKRGFSGTGLKPSDFMTPYDNIVKSTTKGASLARNAKLARKRA